MLETVSEITTFLTQDVNHILGEQDESRFDSIINGEDKEGIFNQKCA
jgi:hypothetical protein